MKVGIVGCGGRMGRMLVKGAINSEKIELVGGTELSSSELVGKDIASVVGLDIPSLLIEENPFPVFKKADVIIDFTTPQATVNHAKIAVQANTALVVGTTGLSASEQSAVTDASAQIAIVQSGNMSLGVNLVQGFAEKAAKILGKSWDVELIEMHHRHKIDSPSGTALMLGKAIARGLGVSHDDNAIFDRSGRVGARPEGEIGYSVLRGGDVVGDHSIVFAGPGERVEFNHRASDRNLFVEGALRAALWASGRKAGLYSMREVLGLD